MAQNVTVAGASYSDVPSVALPKTGGGTSSFFDVSDTTAAASDVASGKYFYTAAGVRTEGTSSGGGGGDYPWFGPGTTYVGRILNQTINLSTGTSYNSWSASTTAGTIKAASTGNDCSQVIDRDNTWWLVYRAYVDVAFNAGATLKNTVKRYGLYYVIQYYSWPSDNGNLTAGTNNTGNQVAWNLYGIRYYGNTTGTLAYSASTRYGPMYIATPTVGTSGTTVTIKNAAIQARCSSTYFATARKTEVDSANTNMVITVDVYKTPCPNSFHSRMVENLSTDMTSGL